MDLTRSHDAARRAHIEQELEIARNWEKFHYIRGRTCIAIQYGAHQRRLEGNGRRPPRTRLPWRIGG